jgi:hypothetical protein
VYFPEREAFPGESPRGILRGVARRRKTSARAGRDLRWSRWSRSHHARARVRREVRFLPRHEARDLGHFFRFPFGEGPVTRRRLATPGGRARDATRDPKLTRPSPVGNPSIVSQGRASNGTRASGVRAARCRWYVERESLGAALRFLLSHRGKFALEGPATDARRPRSAPGSDRNPSSPAPPPSTCRFTSAQARGAPPSRPLRRDARHVHGCAPLRPTLARAPRIFPFPPRIREIRPA